MQEKNSTQLADDVLVRKFKEGGDLSVIELARLCRLKHLLKGKHRQRLEDLCLDSTLKPKDKTEILRLRSIIKR